MTFRTTLKTASFTPLTLGLGLGIGIASALPLTPALANPCAAKACAQNPCCAKNPCAANPCTANPCAAKNPCAANPCAANPCAAKNPCAANPCAANPCAAKSPCAANPCAANPCAAAQPAELSDEQATREWDRLLPAMQTTYAKSGVPASTQFFNWINVTKSPYQSSTHGDRYLVNIVNEKAKDYQKWEEAGILPAGAIIAKPTIVGKAGGKADIGPLFLMEKMSSGWNPQSLDWKYSMIMADGSLWGETKGRNSAGMTFCFECHNAMGAETDGLLFLPEEYRR